MDTYAIFLLLAMEQLTGNVHAYLELWNGKEHLFRADKKVLGGLQALSIGEENTSRANSVVSGTFDRNTCCSTLWLSIKSSVK